MRAWLHNVTSMCSNACGRDLLGNFIFLRDEIRAKKKTQTQINQTLSETKLAKPYSLSC